MSSTKLPSPSVGDIGKISVTPETFEENQIPLVSDFTVGRFRSDSWPSLYTAEYSFDPDRALFVEAVLSELEDDALEDFGFIFHLERAFDSYSGFGVDDPIGRGVGGPIPWSRGAEKAFRALIRDGELVPMDRVWNDLVMCGLTWSKIISRMRADGLIPLPLLFTVEPAARVSIVGVPGGNMGQPIVTRQFQSMNMVEAMFDTGERFPEHPLQSSSSRYFGAIRSKSGGAYIHNGIDLAVGYMQVLAPYDGEITLAENRGGAGGLEVRIVTEVGTWSYSHMSELFVKSGDFVSRGSKIGRTGGGNGDKWYNDNYNVGIRNSGPHLHLIYRPHEDAVPADPQNISGLIGLFA
jgi:hypothetical protein